MRALDREWQRHRDFVSTARGCLQFCLAADCRHKSCLAEYDIKGAALIAADQKSGERVPQIALRLLSRVSLRMDVEQVA